MPRPHPISKISSILMDAGERVKGFERRVREEVEMARKVRVARKKGRERSVHIGSRLFHMQIPDLTKVRLNNVATVAPGELDFISLFNAPPTIQQGRYGRER